jgi:hypothetical protein
VQNFWRLFLSSHGEHSLGENLVDAIDNGAYPDFFVDGDLCTFLLFYVPRYTYYASDVLECPAVLL